MRRVAILQQVQNPPRCQRVEDLGAALEDWLSKKRQYEIFTDRNGRFCQTSDDSLVAAMFRLMPRSLTGAHTTTRKGLRRGTFTRMVWRPLLKQTKRELAASTARSLEWARSRLVEARHRAQYVVRSGATASSVTKFNNAILSFRQGHHVTEDCRHEDLIKVREGGLLLF